MKKIVIALLAVVCIVAGDVFASANGPAEPPIRPVQEMKPVVITIGPPFLETPLMKIKKLQSDQPPLKICGEYFAIVAEDTIFTDVMFSYQREETRRIVLGQVVTARNLLEVKLDESVAIPTVKLKFGTKPEDGKAVIRLSRSAYEKVKECLPKPVGTNGKSVSKARGTSAVSAGNSESR